MAQVERFLSTINQRYFDHSEQQLQALHTLWEQCDSSTIKPKSYKTVTDEPAKVSEEEDEPAEEEEPKKKRNRNNATCTVLLRSGKRKGMACGRPCMGTRCTFHPIEQEKNLVVRPWGDVHLVKRTSVVFCINTQMVLGYKMGNRIVREENDQVRSVCEKYGLTFKEKEH